VHLTTGIAKMALTQPWQPRMASLEEGIEVGFRVWPSDLDVNVHMNNAKYPVAMEVARWAFVIRAGLALPAARERWSFLVAAQHISYFRPLLPFQRYTVSARVLHSDDAWVYFQQHVRQRGRLAATGLFRMRIKRGGRTFAGSEIAAIGGYDVPVADDPDLITGWNAVSAGLLEAKKREEGAGR
jgi:acyl-CoA thioesterase FadM